MDPRSNRSQFYRLQVDEDLQESVQVKKETQGKNPSIQGKQNALLSHPHENEANYNSQDDSSHKVSISLRIIVAASYLIWFTTFSVGVFASWYMENVDGLYRYGSIIGLVLTSLSFTVAFFTQPEFWKYFWIPIGDKIRGRRRI